jgi:hypothetical protein
MPAIAAVTPHPAGNEQSVQTDGTAADAGGDTFVWQPGRRVAFANGDASSTTITITTAGLADGNAITDYQIAVPAGETVVAGPFDRATYANSSGNVALSYSSVTSLTVLVFD